MPRLPFPVESRLPGVGTTIFTVMSRLAADCGALNLSQGFPDFSAPPELFDLVARHMHAGSNQYAPMAGVPALREAICARSEGLYGTRYDPEHEVTVTAGGTQAIFTAITALVRPGDEVIVLEPVYDSYVPAVELAGGRVLRASLTPPGYRPDWEAIRGLLSPRTRMILVNSPHNPTGSVFTRGDLDALAGLVRGTGIVVLSDEVYEHIVFDGARHESVSRHPELAPRSFVVGSFGKTFHVTGWKVGWALAPRELMAEFRKVHQFVVFTVNTPVQLALADFMSDSRRWLELPAFYQRKRDLFRAGLSATPFEPLPCAGTYFQLASTVRVSDEPDTILAERLTREFGVASIPVSAFFADGRQDRVLRFCFAKSDETLERACERLSRVPAGVVT
jgi:methionine aminotransferase